MRVLPLVMTVCALTFLGAGCNNTPKPSLVDTQQTPSLSPTDQALRTDLENVWQEIRASLDQPGGKGYGSFLDLSLHPELAFLKDDSLDQATIKEIKSTVFYDLSRTTFIGVRQENDWAGYFFLRNPQDNDGLGRKTATGTTALVLYPFHQVNNVWKMVPNITDATIELTMDPEKDRAAIQNRFKNMRIKPSIAR